MFAVRVVPTEMGLVALGRELPVMVDSRLSVERPELTLKWFCLGKTRAAPFNLQICLPVARTAVQCTRLETVRPRPLEGSSGTRWTFYQLVGALVLQEGRSERELSSFPQCFSSDSERCNGV